MRDGLTAVLPAVDNESVSGFRQAELGRYPGGGHLQLADEVGVCISQIGER